MMIEGDWFITQWMDWLRDEVPSPLLWDHAWKLTEQGVIEAIEIRPDVLQAKVRAERGRPYKVTITGFKLSLLQFDNLARILSEETAHYARLLRGTLTIQLNQQLRSQGIVVLPTLTEVIQFHCSCSSSNHMCAHSAASAMEASKVLAADPLLLFELRGLPRQELYAQVRIARSSGFTNHLFEQQELQGIGNDELLLTEGNLDMKQSNVTLLRKKPAFWNKEVTLEQMLTPVYDKVSDEASQLLAPCHSVPIITKEEHG